MRVQDRSVRFSPVVVALGIALTFLLIHAPTASADSEVCTIDIAAALAIAEAPDELLMAAARDCGRDLKACSNAKGDSWCCNKDDVCVDTPGGCKKGESGRKPSGK